MAEALGCRDCTPMALTFIGHKPQGLALLVVQMRLNDKQQSGAWPRSTAHHFLVKQFQQSKELLKIVNHFAHEVGPVDIIYACLRVNYFALSLIWPVDLCVNTCSNGLKLTL